MTCTSRMDLAREEIFALIVVCCYWLQSRAEVVSEDSYLNAVQNSAPLSCSEGFTELGYYNGTVSQTDAGAPCLKWTEFPDYVQQYPGRGLGDHRYCRNPDRESNPWCFFRQGSGAIGWAYCDCHQGATRLVGGSSSKSGRLEVYLNGQWGAVCDTHWTDRDASVVCSQLGLGEIGTGLRQSYFGAGSGLFHYERLGCRGNEKSLSECQSRKFVTGDCSHGNEAGVVCAPPEGNGAPLRLVDGLEDFEGRVEVYREGRWGSVCDDLWDDADAEVVCRQLGLGGNPKAWSWAHFGQGRGPILLDAVQCTGNELTLDQCRHGGWEQHNCDHMEDAGVSCSPYTDGVVRLVGADSPWEGRVEVHHGGDWGTVCGDVWTQLEAQVVCQQLGFRGRAEAAGGGVYGEGTGIILLAGVRCTGTERSLLECEHGEWGRHECSHDRDVGVRCESAAESNEVPRGAAAVTELLVRLVGGESRKEGLVEVFVDGTWGSVCDDSGWDDLGAAVVCRQLGFAGESKARSVPYSSASHGPAHLGGVRCSGEEPSLGECPSERRSGRGCPNGGRAGVACGGGVRGAAENEITAEGAQTCGVWPEAEHRRRKVAGGDKSVRGDSPWQVSLWLKSHSKKDRPLCGATLINSCWALTAAHCFSRFGSKDPSRYLLRLGDHRAEGRSLELIVVHQGYRRWEYDLALLRLPGEEGACLNLNPHIASACLPVSAGHNWGREPVSCIATGWGVSDPAHSHSLLQARVPFLPWWRCKQQYGENFTSRMLCAGSPLGRRRDSCHGDGGSPLVCRSEGGRWVLTGVASEGHGCGDPTAPGAYTRVGYFLHWIYQVTGSPPGARTADGPSRAT